jgi:hypothetical protein
MSWQEALGNVYLRRWPEALGLFSAYLRADTRRLFSLSLDKPRRAKGEIIVLLFSCAAALLGFAGWLLNDIDPTLFPSFVRATLISVGLAAICISPYFLAFHYLKRTGAVVVLNILLIQQALLVGPIAASWFISEHIGPAKSDFARLEKGFGQGTVAYERTCGRLDINLETAVINRRLLGRNRRFMHAIKTVDRWRAPISQADAEAKAAYVNSVQSWRQRSLVATAEDNRRFLELSRQFVTVGEEFDRTYWNLRLAENVIWMGAILIGLLSTFHIVRGLFLGAATKSKKWMTAAVVAGAWIIGGGISAAVQLVVARPGLEQISLADLDPGPIESVADLERINRELREETRAQEADLRGLFEEARAWCPGASNHGLW